MVNDKSEIKSQVRMRNELEEAKSHQEAAEERVRLAIGELEEQKDLVIRLQRIEWERGEENAELRRKHQADLAAWQQERETLRSVIMMLAGK
jgi:hypothetical protein